MKHVNTDFYDSYHQQNLNKAYSKIIDTNNFTYFHILKWLKNSLSYLPERENSKTKILDIGCGVGTLSFYLANQGYQVMGVDISKKAIAICQQVKARLNLANVEFRAGDVTTMKLSGKYDLIVCSEVIEHVSDDQGLLKQIYQLLKPNGILLLTTPSVNAPLYRLGWLTEFDKRVGHLRRYEFSSFQQQVDSVGFEVLETHRVEGVLRNSLFMIPLVGKLIKLIRGPLVPLFHVLDDLSVKAFGESDLVMIARKRKLIVVNRKLQ